MYTHIWGLMLGLREERGGLSAFQKEEDPASICLTSGSRLEPAFEVFWLTMNSAVSAG